LLKVAHEMRMRAWTETSSALTGSSAMTRRGSSARQRAKLTRWHWPPLISRGKASSTVAGSPTSSSSLGDALRNRCRRAHAVDTQDFVQRLRTVMRGLSEPGASWNTICTARR
jgi:hypothetical protein